MQNFESIVILTGAGISAESGIKTFRASDGLWENHRIEEVATPQAFASDPKLVHEFYNARRHQLLLETTKPNLAHFALAHLEKSFSGDFLLVTQNIDDLHEQAGSKSLIHMHGELMKMRCNQTEKVYSINPQQPNLSTDDCCDCCHQSGNLRPHIVWFGEMPIDMDKIYAQLEQCDLFISIGTSGNVYPAAGFVGAAKAAGAHTVEINLEPSAVNSSFDECVYGMAGEEVPRFVDKLLG
jgi:NAD-dependent deacetylase